MATVYLPLSSLSRKILVAEYGHEPIVPGRADWLSDVLRVDRRDTQFQARALSAIQTGVLISVSPGLADQIARQCDRLGVVLHRLHIEMLTRIMLAASNSGNAAKTAMQTFYETYNLDDDDLSQESAYREYQRFRRAFFEKKSANSAKKNRHFVLPDSRIWQGTRPEKKTLTNAQLDALCCILDERLQSARIRRLRRLTLQAHLYIYAVLGRRNYQALARKFQRHPANVYRAMNTVRRRIRQDERFAAAILPILNGSIVLPVSESGSNLCTTPPPAAPAISNQETL